MINDIDKPIDILVASTACHTAINRSVYKDFIDSGFSVVLVVPTKLFFPSGDVFSEPAESDDPPIIFLDITSINSRVSRFKNIYQILNKFKPRIVLLDNDPVSISAFQMGLWAKVNKARLFCISCENMPFSIYSSTRNRGIKGFASALFKRVLIVITRPLVHCVFTINNEGTDIFKKELFKKVVKIPLGFDSKYFSMDQNMRLAKREEMKLSGCVFGYFGRISREKGVHVLLSALEKMLDYEWTLIMDEFDVYKNNYGSEVFKIIVDSKIINRTIFINPSHKEIGGYINIVDAVMMPSITTPTWIEQYGRIAAESLACGKLVVASDTGAIPMLLNSHGVLFKESDSEGLRDILTNIVKFGVRSYNHFDPEKASNYAHKNLNTNMQMKIMIQEFTND